MSTASGLLYFFAAVAAVAAVSILAVRNVMHAVLLLLVCLLSVSGLYVLLSAEFLAITQILMYAGGVVVLILFGVMITRGTTRPLEAGAQNRFFGFLTGLVLFVLLVYCLSPLSLQGGILPSKIRSIGLYLMTDYAAPFELSGVLLLVSLVGAAVTARMTEKK